MPMGTIVTVCMLIGLIVGAVTTNSSQKKSLPNWLTIPIGVVVFAGGAWNTFWHGLRHPTEFWGIAALVSGLFMMLVAVSIIKGVKTPAWLISIRPWALVGLLCCFLLYAITIYRL